jgi:hypothetical protein
MPERQVNAGVVLGALLALGLGVLIGYVIWGGSDTETVTVTSTAATTAATTLPTTGTTTTTTGTTTDRVPVSPQPTITGCISLWNRANNTAAQNFLRLREQEQAVRIHVGATAETPPKCLVTLIANDGTVFRFAEGGGTTFPYAPTPSRGRVEELTSTDRNVNAVAEPNGQLSRM